MSLNLPDRGALPNLSGIPYPSVAYDATCTDPWTPSKTCMDSIHVTRPWTFVTTPLAQLTLPWATRKSVASPVSIPPPSFGTLCIVPTVDPPTLANGNLATGTTGSLNLNIQAYQGDKCNQAVIPSIVFPCTQVVAGTKNVTMNPGGSTPSWVQNVIMNYANATCESIIQDTLHIPCSQTTIGTITNSITGATGGLTLTATQSGCNTSIGGALSLTITGGGGISIGGLGAQPAAVLLGPFLVGTSGSHSLDPTSACATSYPPGAVVPIYDSKGLMGTPNVQLSAVTNNIINQSTSCLSDGDQVSLYADGGQSPTSPTNWNVVA